MGGGDCGRGQPSPPVQQLPASASTMHQIKTGPNGNFVMYDKGGSGTGSPPVPSRTPLSPAARRPLPQSPPPTYYQPESKPSEPIYNIYSQPNYSSKPLPPAYSSAPPYRPKESNPAPPQRPTPPPKPSSPLKQVHFAASPRSPRSSPLQPSPGPGRPTLSLDLRHFPARPPSTRFSTTT